ncbi:MAG: Rrf2 family transcriptional regulator, partial [Gemmatimonadota bacterium]|nr:Rrf2 family transcriptional regulator [Gemmatimonadota bacterium]
MQLTKESEHALVALEFLIAQPPGEYVALADIAEAAGLPRAFLAKTFQKLARHDVLLSSRGRSKGYTLARPADSISVLEVFVAVEGPRLLQRCTLWPSRCSDDSPCVLHPFLKGHIRTL